jgi:CelD/BcsL family acetyltransferase involved in cellulose biosynthesis
LTLHSKRELKFPPESLFPNRVVLFLQPVSIGARIASRTHVNEAVLEHTIRPAGHVHWSLPVAVEWITSLADFKALAPEWKMLESRVKDRSVFSTFDLLDAWYGNYAGDYAGDPLIGVARREGKLVGVAPLLKRRGCLAKVPLTRAHFATHDAYSGEFLVEDDRPEIIRSFVDSLAGMPEFDLVCFNGIEPGTRRFLALEEAAASHGWTIETSNHPNAMVDLRDGYQSYCQRMSRNFRRTLKRQAERVAEVGTPVVEGVQLTSGVERLESCIDRLFAVTEASYKLKGQRLADHHRGCLGDLARKFGARGMLHLSILSIGARDAAVVMGLVERGCYYDVTLAYDEEFASLSPGAYLMQQVLSDLAARGVHKLVSHGAHEYKQRWSTSFVPSTRVFLFSRNGCARLGRFLRFRMAFLWQKLGSEEP